MRLNLLSKTLPAFGLNVSGSSFKIVQMEKTKHAVSIKSCHAGALPKGMIVNDAITDAKSFNFLLKQALQQPQFGKVNTNYVVASLPESKSFVRVIQIPQMSLVEAENAVPYESESFIPMPIDQVYLDWQKIGDSGDKMNILIVASPKEFVDKYLEVLDKAGLKTLALEVESQSVHRALAKASVGENMLLVNLGSARTSMIMVEDGNLQFTSSIPVAGNSFTESVARALGVSSAKAEEIKKKIGIANTAEYPNITTSLLPVLNNLSEEIKNILKFHNEHSQKPVDKVVLLGAGATLKNLPEVLAPQLVEAGIKTVELANPWQNLTELKFNDFLTSS
jgi:type IV pilus assembly protein PilM